MGLEGDETGIEVTGTLHGTIWLNGHVYNKGRDDTDTLRMIGLLRSTPHRRRDPIGSYLEDRTSIEEGNPVR